MHKIQSMKLFRVLWIAEEIFALIYRFSDISLLINALTDVNLKVVKVARRHLTISPAPVLPLRHSSFFLHTSHKKIYETERFEKFQVLHKKRIILMPMVMIEVNFKS